MSVVRAAVLFSVAALALLAACVRQAPPPAPKPPAASPAPAAPCADAPPSHSVYRVLVDGAYVGREVRFRELRSGPFGEELHLVSILSRRLRSGPLDYDLATIRSELTERSSGALLLGLSAASDPMFARLSLVGFNGAGFERVSESRTSIADPISSAPQPLALAGTEVIGLRLIDHLAEIAAGRAAADATISFYDPGIPAPVTLSFSRPEPGSIAVDGADVPGVWVSASRDGGGRTFARVFFDGSGRALEESYPSLHQVRRLVPSLPPFPSAASTPSSSLLSRAYLGVPEQATDAVFRLVLPPGTDPDSSFSFLDEPLNQELTRVGERELELRVAPGAPDGDERPIPEDTRPSSYIDSDAPEIKGALQYLRSGGRTGALPQIRRANATPVTARASLIQNPGVFWRDPRSVADIVARFVWAILPDKRPTFSMADAVTTLEQGTGDCTEHSVLFAALMRAHGIPTRLVAGLYLAQGGYWVYHMWTAYWDGATWRQIDPVNIDAAPGALYVAIGRGATRFTDVRPDVAAFLDRAFSGVSFDLVSASSDGEPLKLAYPRTPGGTERDAAAFNAAVLAVRGDPAGALAALDAAVSGDTATVTARLFRAELLVQLGRYGEALEAIAALRRITSLPANIAALDVLALRCHVGLEDRTAAEAALARAAEELGPGSPPHTALAARLLFALGAEGEAIDLLGEAIEDAPDEVELLACFADLVARAERGSSPELLRAADERGRAALELSRYADAHLYAAAARVALRLGERSRALAYADAGLVLAPFDRELVSLAAEIDGCPPAPR